MDSDFQLPPIPLFLCVSRFSLAARFSVPTAYPAIRIGRLIHFHEIFHALNVAFGKVDHVPKLLDQIFSVLQRPSQYAHDRQSHHGRAMYAGSAMDVDFAFWLVQGFQRKIHACLEKRRRLGHEIVVSGIIEHLYGVRLGQRTVVKLNLHVDNVRDAAPHQFFHVLVVPDTASYRNPISHPRHVHNKMLASARAALPASGSSCLVSPRGAECFSEEDAQVALTAESVFGCLQTA